MKILKALLLSMMLAIVACSDSDDNDDDNNNILNPEKPVSTEDGNAYRSALVDLIKGSYSGECLDQPERSTITAEVAISDDGTVTAPGASGNLINRNVNFVFNREITGQIVNEISFSTAETDRTGGLFLTLEAGSQQSDNTISARQGLGDSSGITCTNSTQTPSLMPKGLYGALSQFLNKSRSSIRCLGSNTVKDINYEIAGNQAVIDNQTYSFDSGVKSETASVVAPQGTLIYVLNTQDDRSLSLTLNDEGDIDLINYQDQNGDQFACAP